MSARHKAIVDAVNEAMRRMDIEAFLAYCADDFVWTIVGDAPIRGKDALRRMMGDGPSEPPAFTVQWSVTCQRRFRRGSQEILSVWST